MIKKSIPDADLKLLFDFLRLAIKPDLEFNAVYTAVMGSFAVQTRLFRALTDRKRSFVDVIVQRKKRQILLDFSVLPESLVSDALADSQEKKKVIIPPLVTQVLPETLQSVSPTALEDIKTDRLLDVQLDKKCKARGKAKKQTVSRSPITVLIDDSDIQLLNDLAVKRDSNLSQLIRLAVRRLLSS